MATIYNTKSNTLLSGTSGDDDIRNGGLWDVSWHAGGSNVTINSGDGNDTVENWAGDSVTINTDEGKDSVYNYNADYVSINTGAGNDYVWNRKGSSVTINTGAGNDSVENYGDSVTITGGKGNDSIYNNCYRQSDGSIYYCSGDDGKNVLFKYNSGDGNDIIYGFKADSTLSIGGGSYSTEKSGSDVIVTVGNGKISLIGAASLSKVNIKGTKGSSETNTWKLSGTTATYGNLVTVSGVKAISGLSISGNVVTVSKSALNNAKVTISDGYTIKLASDVTKTSTKKSWSLSGTTAKYNQTTTAGYTLANNSITYSKKSTKTLVTVKGVKSVGGLSVNDKIVTVSKASLNAKKVTISGTGYKLALADDVTKPTATAAKWNLNNSTATYQTASTTAGYTLKNNVITYSKKKSATTLATIKGVKSKSGLSVKNKVVMLKNSALNKKVTVGGSYEFNFAAGYNNGAITGSDKADTIKVAGKGLTVTGGKGNDQITSSGNGNVFVYKTGDGKDVINNFSESDILSISGTADVTTSGSDVIFTVGTGKITLAGAADKNFTYKDSDGEHTYPPEDESDPTVKIIPSSYSGSSIKVSDEIITIDASALKKGIKIVGNGLDNSIVGGKGDDTIDGYTGDDTLTGGDGADVFTYMDGDGNDVITDYEQADKISIVSGAVNGISINRRDVVFDVGTYGEKITLTGAADKGITYIDAGGREHNWFNGNEVVTFNDKRSTVTLAKKYWKDNFDIADYGDYKTINAATVTQDLLVKGNENANNISGGHGNDTIYGGKGGDTLEGGDGADVFVYRKGDGKDTIVDYTAEDVIKIESGALSGNVVIKDNDVVFTVGVGKITVQNAAANGTKITIIDEDGKISTQSYGNIAWFLEDDDNFSTDSELSALVEEKTYLSAAQIDSFGLSKEENFITYSVKNILRGEKIFEEI